MSWDFGIVCLDLLFWIIGGFNQGSSGLCWKQAGNLLKGGLFYKLVETFDRIYFLCLYDSDPQLFYTAVSGGH